MRALQPRRSLAAAGMLLPGALAAAVSVYVVLAGGDRCSTSTSTTTSTSCASSGAGVAVATFPLALVCIVVGAGVLRGARWTRWPAVILGAVLATVVAAGALAGVVAIAGDGTDTRGAVAVGFLGAALAVVCSLPPVLLSGARGEACFPPRPDDDEDEGEEA